jgi:hypothetical protein
VTTLLWFRRDLRLHDLPLLDAVANGDKVLACFMLDPRLETSSGQRRMQFLCNSLQHLRLAVSGFAGPHHQGRRPTLKGQRDAFLRSMSASAAASSARSAADVSHASCRFLTTLAGAPTAIE